MNSRKRGFTLIELLVVMTIIGIVLGLILQTAMGARRSGEKAACEALITKLDTALTDRMQAIMLQRVGPTATHIVMAKVLNPTLNTTIPYDSPQRAQVIAQFDFVKAEIPDTFLVQAIDTSQSGQYPINFAALKNELTTYGDARDFVLPMGALDSNVPITGMYGASFAAAGGIYKNLGYISQGYDGTDNDGNGFADDWAEGTMGMTKEQQAVITAHIAAHKPETARSEMLYALLVEGQGPYGSAFDRDDFTNAEVQDTDGDGLPEFVDPWGKPLQFYRWPIMYQNDSMTGFPTFLKIQQDVQAGDDPGPYASVFQARQQNPLDPNQLLLSPSWWSSGWNQLVTTPPMPAAIAPLSGPAVMFQTHFGSLVEPLAALQKPNQVYPMNFDRGGSFSQRRAYYSRPLIISGGPDQLLGVAQLNVDYKALEDRDSTISNNYPTTGNMDGTRDDSGALVGLTVENLIQIENQAGRIDPNRELPPYYIPKYGTSYRNDTSTFLEQCAGDDIANLNENAPNATR